MKNVILFCLVILIQLSARANSVEEGRYVALQTGYGILSSSLSGSGFNSDLPGKGNLIYGLDLTYRDSDNEVGYSFKYDKAESQETAPSGLTPADLTVSREDIRLMASFAPWDELESLRLGVGYSRLKTGATETSPNNILTEQISQGLMLNALWTSQLELMDSDVVVNYEGLLYLPYEVRESAQVTGYNASYLGAEAKVTAEYPVWGEAVGFFGLGYRYDQVTYSGSVSRGVTDGTDVRTMMMIPVGIKFGY